MRQILIKSILAFSLAAAPGLAAAQTEMQKKKPPEQSEGQGGGQYGTGNEQNGQGAQPMEENGGANGQKSPTENGGENGQKSPMENGQKSPMENEGQQKQLKPKSKENRNKPAGEQGQPTKNEGKEQGGGTNEHRAEKGHVNEQQRGELKRVFREHHVQPAPNINFSVNIGARVPREVHLYRLPPPILEIIPGYEGYMYFELPDGRIAIVDPRTLEIVLIIE